MNPTIRTAELLAQIGREHDLAEIDYEDASVKIHIAFDPPAPAVQTGFDPALLARISAAGSTAGSTAAPGPVSSSPVYSEGETVRSPLAGVFYRAPRPDADAFVDEGKSVAAGQVLCIVEAMKLMNEITAERPCKIVRILVENAEAVEEGQPLFVIA